MTATGGLRHRRVLLGASAATAVIVGHLLDALGLLPGVHEAAAVRRAALAPSNDVLTIVGASVAACAAEALLRRRRPWLATLALLGCQSVLLWVPEELGHRAESSGQGEEWGALGVAVGLQVVLAAGAVGVALLVDLLLVRLPELRLAHVPPTAWAPASPVNAVRAGRALGGVRGRGPPVSAAS
jgi:hypothetical protein